jgi:hypothetical protein
MKKFSIVVGTLIVLTALVLNHFNVKIKLGTNEQKLLGDNSFVDAHLNQPLPPFTLTDRSIG